MMPQEGETFEHSFKRQWWYLAALALLLIIGWGFYKLYPKPHYRIVHNFGECADANYSVTESDPQTCRTPYGKVFTQDTTAANAENTNVTALVFDTLVIQNDGGPVKPERAIIASQRDWQSFWSRIYGKLNPVPNLTPVDFGQFEVIAVLAGQKPTVGYGVQVTNVSQSTGKIVITIRDSGPPAGCIAAATPTSPLHIIKIAKTNLPISYIADPNVSRPPCLVKSAAKTY